MEGLDKFRKAFEAYSENYVIIGGTACDIAMTGTVVRPRATHDIDMRLWILCWINFTNCLLRTKYEDTIRIRLSPGVPRELAHPEARKPYGCARRRARAGR